MIVALGVFAHNEESNIASLLQDLARQVLPDSVELKAWILCNGCTDQTAAAARRAIDSAPGLTGDWQVVDWSEGGKSRTWNRFRQMAAEAGAACVLCVDGDIRIPHSSTLADLLEDLQQPGVVASVSRPIPCVERHQSTLAQRLFLKCAKDHVPGQICGQLYAVTMDAIAEVSMPVPSLVEDGFLAACLVTDLFNQPADLRRVHASQRASHQYFPPQAFSEFCTHNVRLALGTEMNAALFTALWEASTREQRLSLLQDFAKGEEQEKWYAHHERHPRNSALRTGLTIRNSLRSTMGGGLKAAYKFPLHFGRTCYQLLVNVSATRRFRARVFRW